jgi:predicted nucleic acid-binding protein
MNSVICVDSNIVLKLAVTEEDSDIADRLWQTWRSQSTERVAPTLIWYELSSTLRNRVHRGSLTAEEAVTALEKLLDLKITSWTHSNLHREALSIANQLERPNAYDTHYLALARELGCPFWTADERLYNSAKRLFPEMHWLAEAR